MNATTPKPYSDNRIALVDVLRGFAMMGILLIHHMEHFNVFDAPIAPIGSFSDELNRAVGQNMYFLFGGKCYAIFALMFGFTFWIQMERQRRKGNDFTLRFAWRMLLLIGFGQLHALFYAGDIVVVYAILSVVLLLTWRLPDWALAIITACLLIQPYFVSQFINLLSNPEATGIPRYGHLWGPLLESYKSETLLDEMRVNIWQGQLANFSWSWEHGRFFQTPGLFLVGMLIAKHHILTRFSWRFWAGLLGVLCILWIPMHFGREHLSAWAVEGDLRRMIRLLLSAYTNLVHTLIWVSLICLCWQWGVIRAVLGLLAPFGRMSLTQYISLNIVGAFLYHHYGLGLWRYCDPTVTLFVGLFVLAMHVTFSYIWFRFFRHGPMEGIWHKLTWIKLQKPQTVVEYKTQ